MSPQIIPLKGRKICGDPAEFWRQKLFAFELRLFEQCQLPGTRPSSRQSPRSTVSRIAEYEAVAASISLVRGAIDPETTPHKNERRPITDEQAIYEQMKRLKCTCEPELYPPSKTWDECDGCQQWSELNRQPAMQALVPV